MAVEESEASPLQLGVDESYSLSLSPSGGTLTAPSVWGALRGLETFAQLVQWDGDRYVLCSLPLTLADAPRFAWRGLLIEANPSNYAELAQSKRNRSHFMHAAVCAKGIGSINVTAGQTETSGSPTEMTESFRNWCNQLSRSLGVSPTLLQ